MLAATRICLESSNTLREGVRGGGERERLSTICAVNLNCSANGGEQGSARFEQHADYFYLTMCYTPLSVRAGKIVSWSKKWVGREQSNFPD